MQPTAQIFIAPVTPMSADGRLDLDLVPSLFQLLKGRGADGFYLCGGTGEGMLLTLEERMRLTERWRDVVGMELPVYVHIGCVCPQDAKELARHASDVGVSAISSIAPPVFVARDVKQLVKSFAEIADAADDVPF